MRHLGPASGLLLLAAAGCATFHDQPLKPEQTAAAFERRSLQDAGLLQFLAKQLQQPVSTNAAHVWSCNELALVALYYHPDLAVARAQWNVARAGLRTAGERPNPSLTLAPGYNTTTAEPTPWMPLVAFDIPIETAGKRSCREAQARYAAEAARLRLAATAWQVRSRVRSSFVALLAARAVEALLCEQQKLQLDYQRLLEKQLAAGGASAFDLSQAQLAAQNAQLAWRDAQRKIVEAHSHLAGALGMPVAALCDIKLPAAFADKLPEAPPAAELRRQALLRRADLLAALAEYAASQSALQLEIAKQYPDIHLGPGYQYDQGDNKWTLGLTLTLPLLNRNQGAIGEAEARRAEAAAKFVALQATVMAELDRALAGLELAREKLATTTSLVTLSQGRERMAQALLKAGEISQAELLALRLPLAAAAVAQLDAETQAQQALGALEDALQNTTVTLSAHDQPPRPTPAP